MNNAVAIRNGNGVVSAEAGDIMESVIIKGDLSKLSANERSAYYLQVCQSVGLNPLTKPFEYITLNGKLTLYALRACTDQLRSIHKVSVLDLCESERDGVFIVTAKMQNGEGRTDMAKGAVTINGLKGDALANAIMKAETKAKRRATLSLCGLGFLDETEIETIPSEAKRPQTLPKKDARSIYTRLQGELDTIKSRDDLKAWGEENADRIKVLPEDWQDILRLRYQERMVDLQNQERPAGASNGSKPEAMPDPSDFKTWCAWVDTKLAEAGSLIELSEIWAANIASTYEGMFPTDQEDALAIFRRHETRIEAS